MRGIIYNFYSKIFDSLLYQITNIEGYLFILFLIIDKIGILNQFIIYIVKDQYGDIVTLLVVHLYPDSGPILAAQMVENTSNQYFFSTHAYYMLIDLLEDGLEQVAIFNVYSENGETNVYRLTDEDLADIIYNGVDPFINNEHFLPR